ncbi:unnamed protein product [Psylliodes chrysocephalus]|uniref:CRAL-TRIO domain-containing protein n=1 Tax=Psylliodes chrysocephalus TaxID=3402493 RepID=A0A9P0GFI9_9CUCU|nr:unnamed protein product [Psylliodes chrysocephala]
MPSQVKNLLMVSDAEKKAIFKHYNMSERDFEEIVEIVREWYLKTRLPKEDTINEKIKVALFNCKMEIEKTKRCLEGYYRVRTIHTDIFDRLVPNTTSYALAKSLSKIAVMPKLTPDLCRITIFRVDNPHESAPDGLIYEVLPLMSVEYRLFSGDYFYSNILIIDLTDFGLKNLMKYTPHVCNTLINCMIGVCIRFKNIHFVNLPHIFDKVIGLLKYFLPSEFHDKVRTHQNIESLHEYIPKEYLPSNYGGTQCSLEEIQDNWCKTFESKEEEFKKLLTAKCPDFLEDKIRQKENFGIEGSFRKLTVD